MKVLKRGKNQPDVPQSTAKEPAVIPTNKKKRNTKVPKVEVDPAVVVRVSEGRVSTPEFSRNEVN